MSVRALSWAGVRTDEYAAMRRVVEDVLGIPPAIAETDFVVYALPSGDKLELLGPVMGDARCAWQHFRMPDGKVFELSWDADR